MLQVYDCFTFSHELDMLDVRLHTVAPHVDYIVIVESRVTYSGRPRCVCRPGQWARCDSL